MQTLWRRSRAVVNSTVTANTGCPLAWSVALTATDAYLAATEIGAMTDPTAGNAGSQDDCPVKVSR